MYSKGISWIDDCRIPFVDDIDLEQKQNQKTNGDKYGGGKGFHKEPIIMQMYKSQGRFPANILVSDDMLNDGTNNKSTVYKGNLLDIRGNKYGIDAGQKLDYGYDRGYNDKGSNSRYYDIDKWFNNLIDV
jgi:hypothetical protein